MPETYRSNEQATAKQVVEVWGSLTWLANRALTGSEDITLGRVIIKKGMSNPRHIHPNCDEVLYLLSGTLRHVIGEQTFVMRPGDTTIVPASVPHVAYSIGDEDAEMMVAYPTGQRQFQAV